MARHPKVILKDEHQAFLVQRLAVFDTPMEAAGALKAEFDITISAQRAEAYSPLKRAGCRLGEKWRALFEVTRTRFLERLEEIPEANKAVRVRKLARAANVFEHRGNYVAMADMLERIAKEMGNVHTNRREFSGKDGKPIEAKITDYSQMTDDQLRARLATLIGYRFSELGWARQSDDTAGQGSTDTCLLGAPSDVGKSINVKAAK